jgi:hypothetical protein
MADDLITPDGMVVQPNLNNFEQIHRDFGMRCKNCHPSKLNS